MHPPGCFCRRAHHEDYCVRLPLRDAPALRQDPLHLGHGSIAVRPGMGMRLSRLVFSAMFGNMLAPHACYVLE